MSQKHQIAQHYSLLGYSSSPEDRTAPGAPENLRGKNRLTEVGVQLLWDEPTSGGKVFYYEIFVNDSKWANSSTTEADYPNAEVGDIFKVRAVGVLGLKSAFSNTWTYEGGESLTPSVAGYATSLHMRWNDISDSDQVNFEGYNVYINGVKENSALLSAKVLAYPFFNLTAGSTHTVAVSFEHDGGQESDLFEVEGTVGSQGASFQINISSSIRSYPIIGTTGTVHSWADESGGVIVKEGARMKVTPIFSPGIQNDHPEWSTVETYTRVYTLGAGGGKAEMEFNAGCENDSNILLYDNLEPINVTTDEVHQIYGGIINSWNFMFRGGQCPDAPDYHTSISFAASVSEEDFVKIGDYSTGGYNTFRLPEEDEGRLEAETNSDNSAVTFRWTAYFSLPHLKLYIKEEGDASYPSSPHHSGFLINNNNLYVIDNLADGTYNAKVEYYLGDQSTLMVTSNEVTFTIDTS